MTKFKVGDKVRVVGGYGNLEYGSVHTVVKVINSAKTLNLGDCWWWDFSRFELLKENNMFDLKKDKWFIRTPTPEISKAVQQWLFEQDFTWEADGTKIQYTNQRFLTNTQYPNIARDYIMHSSNADNYAEKNGVKEIKLTLKTVVDSVEYPVIETEQEIKIRELKETIEKAQKQIDEIMENVK